MSNRPTTAPRAGALLAVLAAISGAVPGAVSRADAADLPARAAPPVELPRPPAFTWTGFYVGVNAGYGFRGGGSSFTDATYGTVTETGASGGFVGGVQAGYNYQFTPGSGLVIGLETDFQGAALGRSGNGTIGSVPYYSVAPSLDWFGTVRGRVGYAFERFMVYGTGGLAYGGGSASRYAAAYPYTLPDTSRLGYAVGAGVEYALTDRITAKLEGLYVNLGKGGTGATTYDATVPAYYGTGRSDGGFGVVRAGLNYRF